MGIPAARELALQPGAPARRRPDLLHGDAGGAAVELELEERLRAAAVDDLDPAVARGALVLDDLDHGVGLAPLALEVQPVAVTFTPALGSRDGGGAARQPLRHAGGVGEQLEHLVDRDADGAGVGEGDGAHRERNIKGGKGGRVSKGGSSSPNTAHVCRPYTDRKSTRLNSSHGYISYAVFCLK